MNFLSTWYKNVQLPNQKNAHIHSSFGFVLHQTHIAPGRDELPFPSISYILGYCDSKAF